MQSLSMIEPWWKGYSNRISTSSCQKDIHLKDSFSHTQLLSLLPLTFYCDLLLCLQFPIKTLKFSLFPKNRDDWGNTGSWLGCKVPDTFAWTPPTESQGALFLCCTGRWDATCLWHCQGWEATWSDAYCKAQKLKYISWAYVRWGPVSAYWENKYIFKRECNSYRKIAKPFYDCWNNWNPSKQRYEDMCKPQRGRWQ